VSAGVALLAPLLPGALALSAGAVQAGYVNWIGDFVAIDSQAV
jgi:hypothetical protein